MTVSIIILIQDRYDLVKRCLESILLNTKSDFELILVMQAVKDERVIGLVSSLTCKKTILLNQENTGVTPGRNLGITMSSGDLLLFFDDDAYVSEDLNFIPDEEKSMDWLERMSIYFKNPNVGIVSQTGNYIEPSTPGTFWECKGRGVLCDVGQGYCFMFSRDVVESIGLLDEYFGKFWHEESEFALRAKAKGFSVVDSDYIGVTHYGSGSGDDGTYNDKIRYMFNKWSKDFDRILVKKEDRV